MNRKTKLFGVVFDLNQTPLSSPRETMADGGDDDVVVIEPPVLSLPKKSEAQPVVSIAGVGSGLKGEERNSCRDADVESIRCIDCGSESRSKGPQLVEKVNQWLCFKCLLKDRGGDGVGSRSGRSETGGGGIAFLDINASPPREMEVEAVDDVKWDRNQEKYEFTNFFFTRYFRCKVQLFAISLLKFIVELNSYFYMFFYLNLVDYVITISSL